MNTSSLSPAILVAERLILSSQTDSPKGRERHDKAHRLVRGNIVSVGSRLTARPCVSGATMNAVDVSVSLSRRRLASGIQGTEAAGASLG